MQKGYFSFLFLIHPTISDFDTISYVKNTIIILIKNVHEHTSNTLSRMARVETREGIYYSISQTYFIFCI